MQLVPQVPTKSLQLAHLRQNLIRKDVDTFKANVSTLLQRVEIAENNNEREENMKNLVSDFLKDTYYKGTNEINTRGNYDLVIHQNLSANSPVSVIAEVKRPSNNAEMISVQNPNTKALQELLHYFLQESFIKGNKEIKHLIITNIYEWYIFDAAIFEKIFFENKKLIQQYKSWNDKKLGIYRTDWLYNELIKPFIDDELKEIPCACFSLKDYKEIVEKTDKEEDKKLISLYKIFSPAHLLKHSFENDANTLNKEFYFELLHILGLEEIKDGGQKIIQRNSNIEKFEGSLLDNIINKLSLGNKFKDISSSQSVDNQEYEIYIFDIAMELCINWLNRILFLKLLEGQLIKYHKGNRNYAFLNIHFIKDFDELEELFFEVLAIPVKDRKDSVTKKFGNIPYLNSSLFEYSDLEKQYISIGCLKDRLEMPIYRATVLKDGTGNRLNGKKNTLEYLFQFLNSFNFGSESNEEIQQENKTIINAAVLGLIFEKINGYQDGSFFTPSFITTYMCSETIRKTIIQKFNEKYSWNCTDFENLKDRIDIFDTKLRKEANEIVNSIKICDPAVGSGHFLVSALNELIAVKNDLQILSYRNGDRIREYKIEVGNDEIIITDKETGKLFEYRLNQVDAGIDELQKLQEAFFHEKQNIIENCLFGVDINPKSVAICRLRLWIELLKNMYYTKESKFLELETLPNIDINIKCGNSLVSRFGLGNAQNLLPKDRLFVKNLIDKYKIQVIAYKSVKDLGAKDNIRQQINLLKIELEKFVVPNDKDFEALRKKEAELGQISFAFDAQEREKQVKLAEEVTFLRQKYTQKLQTLYRNSFEWRFDFPEILDENGDFVGFDAIIGNPPYGLFNKKQNQKIALSVESEIMEILKIQYPEVLGGTINAARIFYALGFKLLKNNGLQSMIIPFGILTDTTSAKLRKYIFENYCFFKIDAFPERDNMKRRVFEDVKMSTAIVFTSKGKSFSHFDIGISYQKEINTKNRLNLQYADIQALNNDLLAIPLTSEKEFRILQKVYTLPNVQKLGTLSPCLTGEVDINLAKNAITKDKKKAILVKGVQIDRYIYKSENENISQGVIEFLDEVAFKKYYKGEKLKHAQIERIVIQGLSGVNEEWRIKGMLIEPTKYLANSCNYLLPTPKISAQLLLALLNSKLLNFIFKCNSTSSNVNGYEVDNLPILLPENPQLFVSLVNEILNAKNIDAKADISDKLQEIDKLVYKLYNLTKEEIAIIEGL